MHPKISLERTHAVRIFGAAVEAVQPSRLLRKHLRVTDDAVLVCGHRIPKQDLRQLFVVGAGKAAAAMAVETEAILGDLITGGLVTTKYGHSLPTTRIKVVEAAHPTPDANGVRAVAQTVELLRKANAGDLVICQLSGGASALWCDPPVGVPLPAVQQTSELLLRSGATIGEVNTVRKHLSRIKGGQLIRYCGGARVFSLILSDVPGDDPGVIASGPTVADASTFEEAYAVLVKYDLPGRLPTEVVTHLQQGRQGRIEETPKPGAGLFNHTVNSIVGSNRLALLAAEREAKALGYHTFVVPGVVTGDAEAEARKLVALAAAYPGAKPLCLLQGGETTVRVTGSGKGGRNQHFALAALEAMRQLGADVVPRLTILSGGTDGTDGPTDAAGGVVDAQTLSLAAELGLSIDAYLEDHNAYPFLQQTASLLLTGPTQTNVMDLMIAVVK